MVYTKLGIRIIKTDRIKDKDYVQLTEMKVQGKKSDINIILVYRSPNSSKINTERLCEIVRNVENNSIIIGDINLPGIDWEARRADRKGTPFLEAALEAGLQQLVSTPTHNKGNRLDFLLTNVPEKIISVSDVGCLGKSDHCMLMTEFYMEPKRVELTTTKLLWNKANYENIRKDLGDKDWSVLKNVTDVEAAWDIFKKEVEKTVEANVPKVTVRVRSGRPRWMTKDITRLIRQKKAAWKLAKKEPTSLNKARYEEAQKKLIKQVKKAKRKLEKDLLVGEDRNGKKFRSYIKSKTKSRTSVGPLKGEGGGLIQDDKEMAEEFNKFFTSVFTKEDSSSVPEKDKETNANLGNIYIKIQQVKEKIRNLRADSAAGPDGIGARILKEAINQVSEPLQIIFNRSIRENSIPADWKTADVVPIYKKGEKGDPGNYRPVSLTSIPCKLLESIIKDSLMAHLTDNSLIKDSQHGFMTGRSCATNLITYFDKVTELLDRGKSADVIYLDFAKAFDKVPVKRLLAKLRAKGVTGVVYNWLENWLTGRKQRVTVGKAKSSYSSVDSGVPQGSVLGPCLFIVFIDDLDDYAELLDLLIKFADDTKGLKEVECEADRDKMQQALDGLCNWAKIWGMKFNVGKCKIMHIGPKNKKFKYYMEGKELAVAEEEKDVGVLVHHSMKPAKQCQRAAGMAGGVLRQLTKNFHYRDRNVFLGLYKQYVRPHLEFASPAWAPWLQTDKQVLENVQKKAVGMVSGLKESTYEDKCRALGLQTLEERRRIQDLMQTHGVIHHWKTEQSSQLISLVGTNTRARTRMESDPFNIRKDNARTDLRKYAFRHRVVDEWNSLDARTKSLKSKTSFKSAILGKTLPGGRPL